MNQTNQRADLTSPLPYTFFFFFFLAFAPASVPGKLFDLKQHPFSLLISSHFPFADRNLSKLSPWPRIRLSRILQSRRYHVIPQSAYLIYKEPRLTIFLLDRVFQGHQVHPPSADRLACCFSVRKFPRDQRSVHQGGHFWQEDRHEECAFSTRPLPRVGERSWRKEGS